MDGLSSQAELLFCMVSGGTRSVASAIKMKNQSQNDGRDKARPSRTAFFLQSMQFIPPEADAIKHGEKKLLKKWQFYNLLSLE